MNEPKYVGNYARITDVSKYPPEDAALLGRIGLINDVSIMDDAVFAVSIMIDDREELINVGHFEVLGAQEVGRIADDTNRLTAALKFIEEYAYKQFNATKTDELGLHEGDLYTIAQLCLEALDGKPLTPDMVNS